MTRTPSGSPTELEARVAVLERAVHTALGQLGATDTSRADDDGVRLAVEVLQRALRPDSARPAPPLACFWLQEPDGSRWLVPGCMDRMHDPDIDACTCHHLDYRLAVAERHRAEAQRAHDGGRNWTDAVIASVHAHPDGTAIMRRAAEACDTSHQAGAEKVRHRRPKTPSAPRSVH